MFLGDARVNFLLESGNGNDRPPAMRTEDYMGERASIVCRGLLLMRKIAWLMRVGPCRLGLEFLRGSRSAALQAKIDLCWLLLRSGSLRLRIALGQPYVPWAGLAAIIDHPLMRSLIDSALPKRNLRWARELLGSGSATLAAQHSMPWGR